jgi:hypothetical protein
LQNVKEVSVLEAVKNMCAERVLYQDNLEITMEAVAEMTSQSAGIGKSTVCRIRKEANVNDNVPSSPK